MKHVSITLDKKAKKHKTYSFILFKNIESRFFLCKIVHVPLSVSYTHLDVYKRQDKN